MKYFLHRELLKYIHWDHKKLLDSSAQIELNLLSKAGKMTFLPIEIVKLKGHLNSSNWTLNFTKRIINGG